MPVPWPKEPDYPDLPYEVVILKYDNDWSVIQAEVAERFSDRELALQRCEVYARRCQGRFRAALVEP